MKKKVLITIMALSTLFSNIVVFGNEVETETAVETTENNVFSFVEEFEFKTDETLETLNIETAVEKAIDNSTALKTANLSLKVSEEQLENSQFSADYNTGSDSLQTILSLIKNQASYKNSEEELKVQEQKIAYEMEQTFIDILSLQRELQIAEDSFKVEEKNLAISKLKANMGLISQQEYNEALVSFEKSKVSIEYQKTNIQNAFTNLNIIMGESDTNKQYNLSIDVEYEPVELELSVEDYAEARVLESVTIQNAKRNLSVTEQSYIVEQANISGTMTSLMQAENSVATSEMNLSDSIENMEVQVINLYNTIKSLETNIENNKTELANLKNNYEISKIQYEMGKISEVELMQAENKVISMENTIINQIYEHSQNVKKFENVDLM